MLRVSHQDNVLASCVMVGVVLLFVSLWGAVADWTVWGIVVSAACGLWFVIQPFLGYYANGAYWGIVVPGVITLFLDLWTALTYPALGLKRGGRAS